MNKVIEKLIPGMFEIFPEKFSDDRGQLIKLLDLNYLEHFLNKKPIIQINKTITKHKFTIRGMHFQKEPFSEYKVVSCHKGKVFDVVIDLRIKSKTYLKWDFVELNSDDQNIVIVPEGCAHGFQTFEDNSELMYFHTNNYSPKYEDGIRYDDPLINIDWPHNPNKISSRDLSFDYIKL